MINLTKLGPALIMVGALLPFCGCADYVEPPGGPAQIFHEENGRAFITDVTGKAWDITHARDRYGIQPSDFQFGSGPFAIRPINDPLMWSPGESGYPGTGEVFRVLAARLNGMARAYPLDVMSKHEIANEKFGETYVAVGY